MIGVVRAAQNRQLQLLADARIGTTAGAQSYTIPAGVQYIDIELYGGGGGGGAANSITANRTAYYVGGGGGGGGGYVRYGYTGAFGGDVLNFTIGSGGTGDATNIGASGGNTVLTSLTRNGGAVISFSEVIAYGGFGGERATTIGMTPRGGTGGNALNGNISNRSGSNGSNGGLTATNGANGGNGGAGGENDANAAEFLIIDNGGAGGLFSTDTRAVQGGGAFNVLKGAGGGGGGYRKSGTVADAYKGATGGTGGIRIRAYG
jgi:hypothetical protein